MELINTSESSFVWGVVRIFKFHFLSKFQLYHTVAQNARSRIKLAVEIYTLGTSWEWNPAGCVLL